MKRPAQERFWSRVDRRGKNDCWMWKGCVDRDGYGIFGVDWRSLKAHRYAWMVTRGAIAPGLWVLHACDRRGCCNPAHLSLGTNDENVMDKVRKERQAKGHSLSVAVKNALPSVLRARRIVGPPRPPMNFANEPTVEEQFWRRVGKAGPNDCWPWLGSCQHFGHGRCKINGRPIAAHRYAWMITRGPIPKGLCVCHQCDSPACCNPQHLWLGTSGDNNRDRALKQRGNCSRGDNHYSRRQPELLARGERHHSAKLTEAVVRRARALSAAGKCYYALAARCGVSKLTIRRAVQRQSWTHIH